MIKTIIEAESGHACEDLNLEPIQRRLQNLLQSKRYLLVLDDVWDDEQENWWRLKSVLACGAKGASILVTTRLSKVAEIMGSVPPHELSMLSNNDFWELFRDRAFALDEAEQVELEVIGKEIVKKCGGVPLAAKVLGGLLRFKREEKEWLYIKESNLWSLPQSENSVIPALRLSYLNSPLKLRQCFAYCAIFPKDKRIEKLYVIELWMANGFISSNEILDAEDAGDGVWIEGSIWQNWALKLKGNLKIKHMGKVKSVKHVKEANMSNKKLNNLWLSWDSNEEPESQKNNEHILGVLQPDTQHLQSLTVEGYQGVYFPQWMSSSSLKYLTFLKLQNCRNCLQLPPLGQLPSQTSLSISSMIHVKYLHEESYDGAAFRAVKDLTLWMLPNIIGLPREEDGKNMSPCLSKLEIIECPKLLGLPSHPSIINLIIYGECNQDLLSSIHKLSSLKFLWFNNNEELSWFPDGMLQNLSSLEGLILSGLSKLEVLPTETINLSSIQYLSIPDCNSLELSLHGLHPLKRLKILGCPKFNASAGFQCLETLLIDGCREVEGLHEALQYMSALKKLTLMDLPNLESLPDCFGHLPLLHQLTIVNCPKLTSLPASLSLSNLKLLRICRCSELEKRCEKETGEDRPKIAHIPDIKHFDDIILVVFELSDVVKKGNRFVVVTIPLCKILILLCCTTFTSPEAGNYILFVISILGLGDQTLDDSCRWCCLKILVCLPFS
ncbi:unnamed protein product [Sphenostylis stenocarpa]|uniref:NB-ARC domain-containing protein n=1 Tax=Sphenostylis stenocarpa TaxID=92480 RepID=A0AA86VE09_9FABA|nr:unnamed protein product [Sphenostylis stenocarpa]